MAKLEARPELEARRFMWTDQRGYVDAFQQAVAALLAPDDTDLRARWSDFASLRVAGAGKTPACLRSECADIGDLFLNLRARKAPEEIANMQRAIDISEAALQVTMQWARPGMTERQIADRLSAEMLERGAQGVAFLLVLTGEKSWFAARRYRRPRLGRG